MEPRIQYAKTADGVRIAFTTVGRGYPLVVAGEIADAHVQLLWEHSPFGPFYKRLASKYRIVKYDHRGFGLSDRDVTDFSLDARLLDLEAVVDQLGQPRFALLGATTGGPLAVTYSVRYPHKVPRLILVGSWPRGAEMLALHRATRLASVMWSDWELFLENLAAVNLSFGKEESSRTAKFLAEAFDAATLDRFSRAIGGDDVTALLPDVTCPALVVHYRGVHYVTSQMAKELTAGIPNSRLIVLDDSSLARDEEAPDAIIEFLAEETAGQGAEPQPAPTPFRTVLFTDLVGHTEMMGRLGDQRGREVLREHERITREVLKAHGGAEVKTMGDGFMASFGSVTRAVECAVALQRAFEERNASADVGAHGGAPLRVRIGLNAGEPIEDEGDLFGATVILAARIAARAEGGEILASDVVRGLCSGKGFRFADRGEHALRGFEEPVRIFEIGWRS